MTTPRLIASFVTLAASLVSLATEPIDRRSAARWVPQPGWTPGHAAEQHSLAAGEDGWLLAALRGQGKEMTWTLLPAPAEMAGEPRWLVLRYAATNLPGRGAGMLVSFREVAGGWTHAIRQDALVPDGQAHAVAVDLWSYELPAPPEQMLLRLGPSTGPQASLRFTLQLLDEPPADAMRLAFAPPKPESIVLRTADFVWQPAANWTPRPPDAHAQEKTADGIRFSMSGQGKSMRWTARLTSAIDLKRTPHVAIRYRASGEFGPSGYACYFNLPSIGGKAQGIYPVRPGDVIADGRWHVHRTVIESTEKTAGTFAAGIDCLSPSAEIEIDTVTFSSVPPRTPMDKAFAHAVRPQAWPAGQDGWMTVTLPGPRRVNPLLLRRLGITGWFAGSELSVEGVPFRAAESSEGLLATGTTDEDDLTVPLPGVAAREVVFLLGSAFPTGEKFGGDAQRDTPLQNLDEPQRASVELRYADGTADEMIPIRAGLGKYGIGRDVGVYAVHPTPSKPLAAFVLHDRMRNAAFGLLGVTLNTGQPRYAEPQVAHLWYGNTPPAHPAAADAAQFEIQTDGKLAWGMAGGATLGAAAPPWAGQPLFGWHCEDAELAKALGAADLTSLDFIPQEVHRDGGTVRVTATYQKNDVTLLAEFTAAADGPAASLLSLRLVNASARPLVGTLRFPTAGRIVLGDIENTWYFCARRGGMINRIPAAFRDEIGESHPLGVDGFFNPATGAGLCFLPRDPDGIFRWYDVGKTADEGGSYALEYLPQTVAPGEAWQCVPVAVRAVGGDWRQQFQVYRQSLAGWYKPQVPRKPWFQRLWSFVSYHPGTPESWPLERRLDFLGLMAQRERIVPGSTDYVHLFGWAMTPQFGHWGAYDHYETVGGIERFRAAVLRSREAGVPVGLYLDGYLVSTASDKPTRQQAQRWAIRRPDGQPHYTPAYDAHSMCPSMPEWRDYLSSVYRRVAGEVQPSGMYIDEIGRSMTDRTCYSHDHGHPSPIGMSSGELLLAKQVRQGIPPEVATYCEYAPAEAMSQYLDGAYQHVALYNYRDGFAKYAPHFVDLQRFALPDFKLFELIYYVPLRNGNWFLWKYPFFNGDGYYLTDRQWSGIDEHAAAFLANVMRVQHAHRDAFTSMDVEPLVATSQPGLYANRFSVPGKTVWTLFNANCRTVRGAIVAVPHTAASRYRDAWNGDRELTVRVRGERSEIPVELGPRAVGCVVQDGMGSETR